MSFREKNKLYKPKIVSRIPVAKTFKPFIRRESEEFTSTATYKVNRQQCLSNTTTTRYTTSKSPKVLPNKQGNNNAVPSDIFVWKTTETQDFLVKKEIPRPICVDVKKTGKTKLETFRDISKKNSFGFIERKTERIHEETSTESDLEISLDDDSLNGSRRNSPAKSHFSLQLDHAKFEKCSFNDESVHSPLEKFEDSKNEKKKPGQNYECVEKSPFFSKAFIPRSNVRPELNSEEELKLREQIEKLSSFIESSEDLRERSESLLSQQRQQLEEEIREKEEFRNKVRCLEELRRNLQRKVDENVEENISLKCLLKKTEGKLVEEKEKVKRVKRECSSEVSKNAELEVVLQTVLQELGSANKLLKMNSEEIGWPWSKYGLGSVESKENWKREKSQFEGKVKLLEMDKKKLRYQIDDLKDTIVDHEHIAMNLRDDNQVLEFRIAELETQLSEMMAKNVWT